MAHKTSFLVPKDEPFNLNNTLYSGQAFGWQCIGGKNYGVVSGSVVILKDIDDGVLITCQSSKIDAVRSYFDLETDYNALIKTFPDDTFLNNALSACPGIRILKQGVWEATISFIISANNNIPRITRILNNIRYKYGDETDMNNFYSFPSPAQLSKATLEELKECGTGYRAPYIIRTAQMMAEKPIDIISLKIASPEDANKMLTIYHGVGPKVADCILLYGLGRKDIFPVDVWTTRFLKIIYDIEEKNLIVTARKARELLGSNAGLAQQFLFHHSRQIGSEGLNDFTENK